jgi:1,4-dihydroxy-2-naphthoate octaprenyltransferase
MHFAVWKKALLVIPAVSREEWAGLDLVSRWLIASRAAVLVMTLMSSILAGLFALRDGGFLLVPWLVLTVGLVLSHATNNMFNDYTDFVRGVDSDNYYRTMYGPQPVAHGLMTPPPLLLYIAVTGAFAVGAGILLLALDGWDPLVLLLLALGVVFVLFYTWPMKYIALGELAVLAVWGPLMIVGGYYVLTRHWDWNVAWASGPYALGVTTVILGKHIDKLAVDREKRIHTLPAVIGEKAARYVIIAMLVIPYALVLALVVLRYFTPVMAVVLLAVPSLRRTFPSFLRPKPETRPDGFPEGQGGWPLYFAPLAFVNNRSFGMWFMAGLVGDVALRILLPSFWR